MEQQVNKLQQKQEELNAKRDQLQTFMGEVGEEPTPEQYEEAKSRDSEINTLFDEVKTLRDLEGIGARNAQALQESHQVKRTVPFPTGPEDRPDQEPVEAKSLGDLFLESAAYKQYDNANSRSPIADLRLDVKTTMTTSAGFAPRDPRTGLVVQPATQAPRVIDVIPQITTNASTIYWMEQTTDTNSAAETAEAGAYPEGAIAFTERSTPVRKIAEFLPVTDEQLTDVDGMRDYINNVLTRHLRQRLDQQLVAGDGNAPNLTGLLTVASIQTQALGSDVVADAIHKAITKVRAVGFAEPTAVLMHPNDWEGIRLTRSDDGMYIFGDPGSEGVMRIWGLPVVLSTYVTENTAIVADFQGYTFVAFRQGIEFEVSNSHSDYFTHGILAIRAQLRAAFAATRAAAICKVTGI
jgi:HK97 family phage major capsid protein